MDQVFLFIRSAERNKKKDMLNLAVSTRMALATNDAFKQFIALLSEKSERQRVSPKAKIEKVRKLLKK